MSFLKKTFRIELIRWLDHFSYRRQGQSWYTPDELEEVKDPPEMVSCGYVIGEDDTVVCIAGTVRGDAHQATDIQYVLKSAIIKREKVSSIIKRGRNG